MQSIVLINISGITWPMQMLTPFLIFSNNLFAAGYLIFQIIVINFDIAHKTCSILIWGALTAPYTSMLKWP